MSGKVRMPHNNRISSSSALNTNSMWSKTIGIDPYKSEQEQADAAAGDAASEHAAGLMLLARMTNVSGTGNEMRGGCPKCGEKGHLRFQCRNTLVLPNRTTGGNDTDSDSDSSSSNSGDDEGDDEDRKLAADDVIPSASSSVVVGSKRSRDEDLSTVDRNRERDQEQLADSSNKKHRSSSSSKHKKKDKKEKKDKKKHKKEKSKHQKKHKHKKSSRKD